VVSDKLHPQTIACIQTRAKPFGVNVVQSNNVCDFDYSKNDISGVIFQYPNTYGSVTDFSKAVAEAK
jgi:glycine dehydrogenase